MFNLLKVRFFWRKKQACGLLIFFKVFDMKHLACSDFGTFTENKFLQMSRTSQVYSINKCPKF